jgi:hypothetical protein
MALLLQATIGFIAGFALGAALLALVFRLLRLRAELALPLGVLVVWGGGIAGSWLVLSAW